MIERAALAGRAEALAGVEVLCLGDVMLDRYVYGTDERVSPEAPIPILRIERERTMLGAAGNVVRNLAGLGARARFLSVIGADSAGREVRQLLAAERGVEPRLVVERGRETGIKTRFVAGTLRILRTDRETVGPIAARSETAVLQALAGAIGKSAVVVISDYDKGVLTRKILSKAIKLARQAKRPVIVDPKGTDFGRYRGADVVTPNRAELAAATGLPVGKDDEIVVAARKLIARCGFGAVLVTRGAAGMTLVRKAGAVEHIPAEAREVFDVSGAGDTVVATVAAALAAGLELAVAARLANVAAGIVVGNAGTRVARTHELAAALQAQGLKAATRVVRTHKLDAAPHTQGPTSHEAKLVSRPQALERIETWRDQGLKIGFTNGCFDLLHPGHVSLLAQARAACDRLVVGLNGDASARRLKGPGRPIQRQRARAAVLASLASVDLVVVFAEDTPLALIEAVRPDVLVKGADYTLKTVVGAEFVRGQGGRVVLARLAPGHSTTATLARAGARKRRRRRD